MQYIEVNAPKEELKDNDLHYTPNTKQNYSTQRKTEKIDSIKEKLNFSVKKHAIVKTP